MGWRLRVHYLKNSMTAEAKEKLDLVHRKVVERFEFLGELVVSKQNVSSNCIFVLNEMGILGEEREWILSAVLDRVLGFGPLTRYIHDDNVSEIMLNGLHSLYVEKNGKLIQVENNFGDEDEILQVINKIVSRVGRRIDMASPMVDARLPDGSRVNAIIAPLSLLGPILTIRRFPKHPPTMDMLLANGTINDEMELFLRACVEARINIVVSGGTGSGKTTTLNALASLIPHTERIVTIEDSAELKISHPHLLSLESRPANLEGNGEVGIRTLLKNALRMRPDRIIVGEIRSGEALDMLQAMNTGHPGSLTTVHANSPLEALHRIETMALMSDVELPHFAIREQVKGAINLVIQQERLSSGERKTVEICVMSGDMNFGNTGYELVKIYSFDKKNNVFIRNEIGNNLKQFFHDRGVIF